jgi:hypothetical protein
LQKKLLGTSRNAATALAGHLNNEPSERDRFIIDLMTEMKMLLAVVKKSKTPDGLRKAKANRSLRNDFNRRTARVNATIEPFLHAPRIDPEFFYDGDPVNWVSMIDHYPVAENAIPVRWLLALFESGDLDRIRQCEQCPRWYVATRPAQRFCSNPCRWKAHASDEDFKMARRAKERERYRLNK